jgi:hypothetical protein
MYNHVCRHCGAPGVATNAAVCPACGGWNPSPGLVPRLAVAIKSLVALAVLGLAGFFFYQGVMSPEWSNPNHRLVVYALSGGLALFGLLVLFWTAMRPYGRPQV